MPMTGVDVPSLMPTRAHCSKQLDLDEWATSPGVGIDSTCRLPNYNLIRDRWIRLKPNRKFLSLLPPKHAVICSSADPDSITQACKTRCILAALFHDERQGGQRHPR